MKKILLSLMAAAVAVTASAGLVSAQKRHLPARASEIYLTAPFQSTETVNGPQKAAGTMTYGLAGELNSVVGFQNATKGLQVAQAFEMTPAVSTQFAGSQITAINTYTGMNVQTRRNNCTLYTAFIIEGDQENAPIATSATFASRTAGASIKIDLREPVTIEAGKTYFWRVDATNDLGTTEGTLWSFTATAGGVLFYTDFHTVPEEYAETYGNVAANTNILNSKNTSVTCGGMTFGAGDNTMRIIAMPGCWSSDPSRTMAPPHPMTRVPLSAACSTIPPLPEAISPSPR